MFSSHKIITREDHSEEEDCHLPHPSLTINHPQHYPRQLHRPIITHSI